jgi:dolichol-phosphate mannosyltransferase
MFVVSVIIPTYNEAKNLQLLTDEIFDSIDRSKIDLEIIFVDDNSPDKTGDVAESLGKKYPIRVIHRSGKLGLGSAVREGFKCSTRPYLGVMDADLSHDPAILNELINSLSENEVAIGSRFAEGSTVENWQSDRKILSKVGVWMAKRLTKIGDPLSGYFFFKRSVIEGVELSTVGYKILLEILVKGHYNKVKEFAFNFRMRKFSTSKLDYKEYILFVSQLLSYFWYKLTN